jgi:hypothetical protein
MSDSDIPIPNTGSFHMLESVTLRSNLPSDLTFTGEDGPLLTLTSDGRMVLGPGLSEDAATQRVAAILKEKYEGMMQCR